MKLLLDTHTMLWLVDHRDPFDRVLIAQTLVEGMTLVRGDSQFGLYAVDVLW